MEQNAFLYCPSLANAVSADLICICRLRSNHEQRGSSWIPRSNQLRTAAYQQTTNANLPTGRIAPRFPRILVVISL